MTSVQDMWAFVVGHCHFTFEGEEEPVAPKVPIVLRGDDPGAAWRQGGNFGCAQSDNSAKNLAGGGFAVALLAAWERVGGEWATCQGGMALAGDRRELVERSRARPGQLRC